MARLVISGIVEVDSMLASVLQGPACDFGNAAVPRRLFRPCLMRCDMYSDSRKRVSIRTLPLVGYDISRFSARNYIIRWLSRTAHA